MFVTFSVAYRKTLLLPWPSAIAKRTWRTSSSTLWTCNTSMLSSATPSGTSSAAALNAERSSQSTTHTTSSFSIEWLLIMSATLLLRTQQSLRRLRRNSLMPSTTTCRKQCITASRLLSQRTVTALRKPRQNVIFLTHSVSSSPVWWSSQLDTRTGQKQTRSVVKASQVLSQLPISSMERMQQASTLWPIFEGKDRSRQLAAEWPWGIAH